MTASAIRLGLIGAGRIAQAAHLPAAEKADRIVLAAIADPNPHIAEGVAARYNVACFTDAAALLGSDVDAVIISAPDRLHLPLATQALDAGKHVLVEKPLATTETDARALTELAEKRQLKLQVGSMKRHDPGVEFARSWLPRIGPLLSVQAWYRVMAALRPPIEATLFPPVVMDPAVRAVEDSFKADREAYLLVTHGAHVFDGMRYLSGDLASVSARVATVGGDISWHGTATIRATGGLASFEITANVHDRWSEGFTLHGESGRISIRSHFPFFRRPSDVSVYLEGEELEFTPQFGDSNAYERQLESFARAILEDLRPIPDGRDGVEAVRILDAVARSTRAGGQDVLL